VRRQDRDASATAEVARRFRAARRQGRPDWAWPDIAHADWRSALRTIETTTRALLTDRDPDSLRTGSGGPLDALGLAAYTSGMGPWLGWHIETGRLGADPASARLLGDHLAHARRRWVRLESELHTVLAALTPLGVDVTVLKGAYGARHWFDEPALRPMSDIDVLVPRAAMQAAGRALAALGYDEKREVRIVDPPHAVWRRRGAAAYPHSLMLMHADDPIDVDLHGSLDVDYYVATIRFGAPSAQQTRPQEWNGGTVRVLAQPLLAAHHAVHAAHGHGLSLIRLTELALMLRHDMRSDGDWSDLDDLLGTLGARRFAWPSLALADQLVPGTVPATVLERGRAAASPRLRRIVDTMTPATAVRMRDVSLRERFMWAAGPAEHARRIHIMLLPTAQRGTLRQLGRIYLARAYQLLRARVRWGAVDDGGDRPG
jgi:hypothetical protein